MQRSVLLVSIAIIQFDVIGHDGVLLVNAAVGSNTQAAALTVFRPLHQPIVAFDADPLWQGTERKVVSKLDSMLQIQLQIVKGTRTR